MPAVNFVSVQDLACAPASPDAPAADACLAAARTGDAAAFVRLVQSQQSRVFSLALRLTGQREEAEELAQDTFLQLHGNLERIQSPEHLRFWLCRTVTHRAIDALRRRTRRAKLVAVAGGEDAVTAAPEADPFLQRRLRALLLQLPAVPRAVVVLRYQEGLAPTQIAAVLALSHNTVKSHLRRSLEWLRHQGLERFHGS